MKRMAEHFRCERYHLVLTRSACALSYRRGNTTHHATKDSLERALRSAACIGCPVGYQHSRGHAEGEPVQLRPHVSSDAPPRAMLHADDELLYYDSDLELTALTSVAEASGI